MTDWKSDPHGDSYLLGVTMDILDIHFPDGPPEAIYAAASDVVGLCLQPDEPKEGKLYGVR